MRFTRFITIFIVILLSYSCSDSTEVITNHPPTAAFLYTPINADTTTTITFDASESSDTEGWSNETTKTIIIRDSI